jgi:2-keto-4-pentenoate hydratase/2-oxohepta-3-ene-1,7-dioic acid hydratase in catechol pathway
MILNDWSARDLQRDETTVRLGPAKGKDFASTLGPWLVTPDELADVRSGNGFDLRPRPRSTAASSRAADGRTSTSPSARWSSAPRQTCGWCRAT